MAAILLNHPIGAAKERKREREAQRFAVFHVDH
jgi:hypothetical protein